MVRLKSSVQVSITRATPPSGLLISTPATATHPRTISWLGASALAMGGSNQMVFLVAALIAAHGSGAVPILIVGLLLSWAAAPGWTELVLMWPDRVGGIAATCAEAFKPYSPVLANLTGVCYWWGWVPTCGFTAILSATALHDWYVPFIPVTPLAIAIILTFVGINLMGVKTVTRFAIPVAITAALLALLSAVVPLVAGTVDIGRATSFHLDTPFHGAFGALTSAMAGLYLVGFAAPAFEAATCHVGEMKDPAKSLPRAVFASGAMAGLFFIVLPLVWLGTIGTAGMGQELTATLGPTFAPLLAGMAKSAAVWFMVANMFMGTMQPLAGAARTLSQLSEDGLLPRTWAKRSRRDVPWVTTCITAAFAIGALLMGVPTWMIAAANFAYLIAIALPSIAVWLLRRNEPDRERPWRAPRGTIGLGVGAAVVWFLATGLGFEQFGLPTVLLSLALAYAGSLLYAWRRAGDRRRSGVPGVKRSLHLKLTGAMIGVIVLDGAGYLLAVSYVPDTDPALVSLLQDIFVAVAMLTVAVGLILPGMIGHAVEQVSDAADRLATGTLADFTRAMQALSVGDLNAAKARIDVVPVHVNSRDEVGAMADSFNTLQEEIGRTAAALDGAREGLAAAEDKLERSLRQQAAVARLGQRALEGEDLRDLVAEAVAACRQALGREVAAAILPAVDGRRFETGEVPRTAVQIPIGPSESRLGVLCVARSPALTADEEAFLQATANVLADAIERLKAEEDMRHQALHDPLTGLPNRALLADRLTHALRRATRGGSVAVLFLDLDQFKLINDSRGHRAGDELLCAVATRLSTVMRPGDTVARFGGDEFCIVSEDIGDALEAIAIAQRLVGELERPYALATGEHFATASIGIALADGPARPAEDLIREADAAMYRAKESGHGRCELFDEVMRGDATERLRLDNDLRRALEVEDELIAHYQPIVSLPGGEIIGMEALARWAHPHRGLVAPSQFIAIAEDSGAIHALGDRVLRQACTQAATWCKRLGERPFYVSVNLSPRQVAEPGLASRVASVLALTGLAPHALALEITESTLMEESELVAQNLLELKGMGVGLVLDDFGTGYSSLAYLRRFPIDAIKIDRRFIAGLGRDTDDTTIVEAIVRMAAGLRLDVVAEGIETAEQARILDAMGCRRGQGYLWSRPVAPVRAEALLMLGEPACT
jgi:diguanylate cyclase (GGDEF)-like protein